MNAALQDGLDRFREDAARWVRPEQVADLSEVTPAVVVRLLIKHPPLRAMGWLRFGKAMKAVGVRGVPSWTQRRLLKQYGLEISSGAKVGGGLYIAHPVGCVLSAQSIGQNVTVVGQATFGTRGLTGWPVIEDEVFIGVGARVLGGITVGAKASVAANAVVLTDVDPGATAVGIPARMIESRP